jgi:N,N'-diacetyllegionaminate synthase
MSKIYIIAEAGVNHNGDINIAKRLVDAAVDAGADAVKFQTFKAQNLVCKNAGKAAYQLETTEQAETQYEMLKKLELTEKMHEELVQYCRERGIEFLSTPFDVESVDLLLQYEIPLIKIPSGEITNYPYLKKIGKTGKKVILSTGMSTLDEVRDAVQILKNEGTDKIILLHCNTEYPTPMCDVNLLAMKTLQEELGLPVGYSDHTKGIEIPIAAAALGACVIEKHFTLDRTMEGPDHKASLEPHELRAMVCAIHNIEQAMGDGVKRPSASERRNIGIVRKSIVAKRDISEGEILSEENITTKRPGTGISPMMWEKVIGQRARKNYKADEMIEL